MKTHSNDPAFFAKAHYEYENMDKLTNEPGYRLPPPSRYSDGLTKREYFAGLAMQALIPNYVNAVGELSNTAQAACDFADALIKELNEKRKKHSGESA